MRTSANTQKNLLAAQQNTEIKSISLPPFQSKYARATSPKIIIDQSSFTYDYLEFMSSHPHHQHLKETIKYLYALYIEICANGGFVDAVAQGKIGQIILRIGQNIPAVANYTPQIVFENYLQYLFEYEVVSKLNYRIPMNILSNFRICRTISREELKTILSQSIEDQYKNIITEDITLIQNFCETLSIRNEMASLQSLASCYKNIISQIYIQQKSLSISHDGKLWDINNKKLSITLWQFKQFYDSKLKTNKKISALSSIQDNQVPICLKFDPQDQCFEIEVFDTLQNTMFGYKGKYDMLSYCDQDNPGVTLPVFMILAKQSWYGPTQTALSLTKIYLNFGLADIVWYCVPEKDILKLRKIVHLEFSIDIMKQQGNWWIDFDWILMRGICVKKIKQKQNEAIIIGPGSLYWYQSDGIASLSHWTIMPKILSQAKSSVNKLSINKTLSKNPQKIPIKSLFLRYFNHQSSHNHEKLNIFIQQSLKCWFNQQQKYLNQLIIKCRIGSQKFQYYKLYDTESYCVDCKQQILQYFVQNFTHLIPGISCLQCFKNSLLRSQRQHKNQQKTNKFAINNIQDTRRMLIVYHRYDQFSINNVINSLHRHRQSYQQNEELCSGEYIGNVLDYCIKTNNQNSQKNISYQVISTAQGLQGYMKACAQENKFEESRLEFIMGCFSDEQNQQMSMANQCDGFKNKVDVAIQAFEDHNEQPCRIYRQEVCQPKNMIGYKFAEIQDQRSYVDVNKKIKYNEYKFKKEESSYDDQEENRTKSTESSYFKYEKQDQTPKKWPQTPHLKNQTIKLSSLRSDKDIFQQNLEFLKKAASRRKVQSYEISNISQKQSEKSEKSIIKYRKKKPSKFYPKNSTNESFSHQLSRFKSIRSTQKNHYETKISPNLSKQKIRQDRRLINKKYPNAQKISFNLS